jgi:pimeloyl-ACP methyl ester carboxylesterase
MSGWHVLVVVAGVVAAVYLVIAALLWRFQERIVFQPPAWPDRTPLPAQATQFEIVTADGVRGRAYQVGSIAGSPPIVAFHGNAEIARWQLPWALEAAERLGTCVFVAEYRGYDGVEGSPTYEGARLDAEAVHAEVVRRTGVAKGGCVLYGHSLGSAVAAELAAAVGCRALALESPFTSAREMVARWPVVGFRAGWSLVSRVHYDTVGRVCELKAPVSVAHGEKDLVVPVRMGRAVHAAARVKGGLLILPTAGHSDVPEVGGERYWAWLATAAASVE